jgi:CBS domain-containing protein
MSFEGRSNLLNPSLKFDDDAAMDRLELPKARAAEGGALGPMRRSSVRSAAQYDGIKLIDGLDQLRYSLQSSVANQVRFKAEITPSSDETFHETGRISFGDGQHELLLSSAGAGVFLPEAWPGRRQGAATLRIDGGTGVFKGATGIVTTNFIVGDEGEYRDVHTAVVSLGEGQGGGATKSEDRMRVRDVIDEKAFPVTASATMETVADLLVLTKASSLMVVDDKGHFIGVVSEVDLLRAAMPDVEAILDVGGTLNDALGVFIANGKKLAEQAIGRMVRGNPRTVAPDDELLAVATVMLKTDARRLPVVERGKFVGSVSLADICWAILSKWNGLMHQ